MVVLMSLKAIFAVMNTTYKISKDKIFVYLQVLVSTCMVVLISVPEELILMNYIFIKSTYN